MSYLSNSQGYSQLRNLPDMFKTVNNSIDDWLEAGFIFKHENSSDCSHIDGIVSGDQCASHGPVGRTFHD